MTKRVLIVQDDFDLSTIASVYIILSKNVKDHSYKNQII